MINKRAQQSVHWTLGIPAPFQAVFYALSFSQSDGVPPPAPAPVTQTVGRQLEVHFLKYSPYKEANYD